MPRGRKAVPGDTRTSPNGYHYTRTKQRWELTHRLVVTAAMGRPLRNTERVRFIDGDRTNLDPNNLRVTNHKPKSYKSRIARLEAKQADIDAELEYLREKLDQA
jgi:hypothetical protein